MNKIFLTFALTLSFTGLLPIKSVLACSIYIPEGTTPPQPKLEGWIAYPEATGFANSNEADYFAVQLQPANSCGGNTIYLNKNFVYNAVPVTAAVLSGLAIILFIRQRRTPKP